MFHWKLRKNIELLIMWNLSKVDRDLFKNYRKQCVWTKFSGVGGNEHCSPGLCTGTTTVCYHKWLIDVIKNLYTDDTKMFQTIRNHENTEKLIDDFDNMKWSEKWLMKFHTKKCKDMRMGTTDVNRREYSLW